LGAAGLCIGPGPLDALARAAHPRTTAPAFPVLTLHGTPRMRGQIHGEALKDRIIETYERRQRGLRPPEGLSPSEYLAGFVAETSFDKAIERWTPDLLEEVRGMADATGLPFETVFAMQLPDELWWYQGNAQIRERQQQEQSEEAPVAPKDKCTVAGACRTESNPSVLGQNLDLPSSWGGAGVVLRIKHQDSDLESLVFSDAGFIAANGLNNHGVALCVNALLQLDNAPSGLPVAFVVRGALGRRTRDAAAWFVRTVRHASGQAYSIGDRERIVCLECSANRVVPFVDADNPGRFVHTNHPLANDDLGLIGAWMRQHGQVTPPNSRVRYDCARERIKDQMRPVDVATLKALLSSHDSKEHPICCHLDPDRGAFTAACTIFELGALSRMHIAGNPPCERPFDVMGF
jgi:hypothetical protein